MDLNILHQMYGGQGLTVVKGWLWFVEYVLTVDLQMILLWPYSRTGEELAKQRRGNWAHDLKWP